MRKRGRLPESSDVTNKPEAGPIAGKGGDEPGDDTLMEDLEGEWEVSFNPDGSPKMTRLG